MLSKIRPHQAGCFCQHCKEWDKAAHNAAKQHTDGELPDDPQALLEACAYHQSMMWDCSNKLERLLNIEIDTTNDLENVTLESLKAEWSPDD